jgi:hypothetical protein
VDAEEKAETPWAQQEAFEAEQIKKASTAGFGAKDKKSKAGECGWVRCAGLGVLSIDLGFFGGWLRLQGSSEQVEVPADLRPVLLVRLLTRCCVLPVL